MTYRMRSWVPTTRLRSRRCARIGRSCAETVLARLDAGYFADDRILYDVALDVGATTAVEHAEKLV